MIRRKTPAKVNLFLEIGRVRKDGYHEIFSVVDLICLYDEIEFSSARDWSVEFYPATGIDPHNNTVTKAINIFRQEFPQIPPLHLKVKKGIPAGAGLAGGSSDGACVLKTLNEIFKCCLSRQQLFNMAEKIGADVPLFIADSRCLITGKGEKVKVLPETCTLWYVLFLPGQVVPTGRVYAWYDELNRSGNLTWARQQFKILSKNLAEGNVPGTEKLLFNRLQESCELHYPEIKKMKIYLEKKYKRRFVLSGSGGTLFSVFSDYDSARECALSFPGRKDWQVTVVSSVDYLAHRRTYGDYGDKSVGSEQS